MSSILDDMNALASYQSHLATLQDWYSLFWQLAAEQAPEPLTPGQQQTLTSLINAIADQQALITTTQVQVQQAQAQVNQWTNQCLQLVNALNAAGC